MFRRYIDAAIFFSHNKRRMGIVGLLFGMEQSFPVALRDRINAVGNAQGVSCEWCMLDTWKMDEALRYDVVLDRISQDVPFYRAVLKNMVLAGTHVVNNPFWWSADEKFFSYAACHKAGIVVPRTSLVPSKDIPPDTANTSMTTSSNSRATLRGSGWWRSPRSRRISRRRSRAHPACRWPGRHDRNRP